MSNEVEVGFRAMANLDLKHGAYNLVKKQTKGVINKVCVFLMTLSLTIL